MLKADNGLGDKPLAVFQATAKYSSCQLTEPRISA
jgi:hypothetical protein